MTTELLKSILLAVAVAVPSVAVTPVAPAVAHHGWSSFDTRHAYYLEGTVIHVRWGNPHSEVTVRVEKTTLPAGFRDRPLPPGANEGNGKATMVSARPYRGEHREIHLSLAGPGWMERWGMNRPLREGETIEVLGFLGAHDSRNLRPVMFWLEDGQGVWQQLTSFPLQPLPAPGD